MAQKFDSLWYSPHRHSNATFTNAEDFSSLFWDEVSAIRKKFWLTPRGFGLDIPLGIDRNWQPYLINDPMLCKDNTLIFVAVEEFRWGRIEQSITDSESPFMLANFLLKLHFAVRDENHELVAKSRPRMGNHLCIPDGLLYSHSRKLLIEFRKDHPLTAPFLYAPARKSDFSEHKHHWYRDGRLCISPQVGTPARWRAVNRSVSSWMGIAIAWSAWHFKRFGD